MSTLKQREKNRQKQRHFQKTPGTPSLALQRRHDEICALVTDHPEMSLTEACAEIGIRKNTEEQWRKRYPAYKQRITYIMARRRGSVEVPDRPYDEVFVKEFFGFDTPAHLAEIRAGILEVEEAAKRDKEPKAILILAPPDHAKSTEVENYLSHTVATDPNIRCLLISKTLGAARKRTGRIQRRLTDRGRYQEFIDTFGPFKSEARADARPWRTDYFTVIGQDSGERDYTLEALGIGGQIYGARAERIVLDDIADLQNQTPAEIDKQLEYIQVEVLTRLIETGVLICIGTHMREADVYSRLEEIGIFDKVIKLQALNVDEEGNERPLWPQRYPLKRLRSIQERDDRLWELVWQQNPLPSVGAIFTMEMIQSCFDENRYIGHVPEGSIIVAGVDPSVSNYTAGVVFALKQTEAGHWMRYLVDVWNEKGLTAEGGDKQAGVVEFIVELCRRYKVRVLCVEDGTWMSFVNSSLTLKGHLMELGVRHHGIPVSKKSTGVDAISQMSQLFAYGFINLPGSPQSKQYLQPMVHQFLTYSGEKQHWRKVFDILKAFRQAEHAVTMLTRSSSGSVRSVQGSDEIADWMVA